jgi:predicted RNA binding protein YcfA (HicA-like mRNA interferase family)
MRLPRDVNGADLVKYLKPYGYTVTRQSGSHIRLTTTKEGEHHVTIPNHTPLKIGTLAAILVEVSNHFNIPKEQLIQEIFI